MLEDELILSAVALGDAGQPSALVRNLLFVLVARQLRRHHRPA
jgi:hypothetical protein